MLFLTLSVRNGPSVSFGTNVPCIMNVDVIKSTVKPAYVLMVSLAVVDCGKDLCTADSVVATPNIIITGRVLRYLNIYILEIRALLSRLLGCFAPIFYFICKNKIHRASPC